MVLRVGIMKTLTPNVVKNWNMKHIVKVTMLDISTFLNGKRSNS
jgi:hypothetical protein